MLRDSPAFPECQPGKLSFGRPLHLPDLDDSFAGNSSQPIVCHSTHGGISGLLERSIFGSTRFARFKQGDRA